jgi:hypothetical protein
MQYRVGKTHCQGHQDPSKRVSIFLGETEALIKMVFIYPVFISRCSTVDWSGKGVLRGTSTKEADDSAPTWLLTQLAP